MPDRPLLLAGRILVVFAVLGALAHHYGLDVVSALLPLYRWEIGILEDRYRILFFGIVQAGADTALRIEVTPARLMLVAGKIAPIDPRNHIAVSTMIGNALQAPVMLLGALLAWPADSWKSRAWRLLAGIPLLALLVAIDVPLGLLGDIWQSLLDAARASEFSLLVAWKDFLQHGGRIALALTGAAGIIAIRHRPARR